MDIEGKSVTVPLESYSCPICLEVPLGEVFLCKNGHNMCSGCLKQMKRCGECRVLLGKNVVRNRAIENILDEATFPCSHTNCKESTLKRKELQRHQKLCKYRQVNVCKTLGYDDCEKHVSTGADFCKHLKDAHLVDTRSFQHFELQHNLKNFLTGCVKNRRFMCWTDILICDGEKYLLNMQLSFKRGRGDRDGTLSFGILYLGDFPQNANKFRATIDISTMYKSKMYQASSLEGFPIHFKCLADYSHMCPSVSVPVNMLKHSVESQIDFKEVADDFDLLVIVCMEKTSSVTVPRSPAKRARLDLATKLSVVSTQRLK